MRAKKDAKGLVGSLLLISKTEPFPTIFFLIDLFWFNTNPPEKVENKKPEKTNPKAQRKHE